MIDLRELKVQTATAEITPKVPTTLAGRLNGRRAERVNDPLEVNVVVLTNSESRVVLVSLDLLYVGEPLASAVSATVRSHGGADAIVLAASHTHSAPSSDPSKPGLGAVDRQYLDHLVDVVTGCLTAAFESRSRQCETRIASLELDHSINRRKPAARFAIRRGIGVVMGPNPDGIRDEHAGTVGLYAEGELVAVLWNYACHPTGTPLDNEVSADFPGAVRSKIRTEFDNGSLPVLFFQGFSAETRPPFVRRLRSPRSIAALLRNGRTFGPPTPSQYLAWTDSIADRIIGGICNGDPDKTSRVRVSSVTVGRAELVQGDRCGDSDFSAQLIRIGELTVLTCTAEATASLANDLRMRNRLGRWLWLVGCEGETFGYLPTREMLSEGGYEACGFTRSFGLDPLDAAGIELANASLSELILGGDE